MPLGHLGRQHPTEVGAFLGQMRTTEDIAPMAAYNRELACLKAMFNVARKGLLDLPGSMPNDNPVSGVKFFDEHNIRDRILTAEEFHRMLDASADYLRPILQCAYYTGMRRGEILALT